METHILHIPSEHQTRFSFSQKRGVRIFFKTVVSTLLTAVLTTTLISVYLWHEYQDKILPHTTVEGKNVSQKKFQEATDFLQTEIKTPEYTVSVVTPDTEYATSSAWLKLTPQIPQAVEKAYAFGHQGSFFQQLAERWRSFFGYQNTVSITYTYDSNQLQKWGNSIAEEIFILGEIPRAEWLGSTYRIHPGKYGQKLNQHALLADLQRNINNKTHIVAPIEVTHTPLSADDSIYAEQRLKTLQPLTITLEINEFEPVQKITPTEFFPWLTLPDGFNSATASYDLKKLTEKWNRPAENAVFELDEYGKLKEFKPHKPGREIQLSILTANVLQSISQVANLQNTHQDQDTEVDFQPKITVPISETPAEIQLGETNSLGVKELLGRGSSTFFGSIPNRVYNVELTSNRLHATLIQPGEEFSFNRSLGEVSASTGYKTAYVIQNGRTVLGDGGGVCQVSTTAFRAILDAGFPITQWKPHSYRVGYYEQNTEPGFDATVYSPSVDLRFKNDTKHAVVLSTTIDVPQRHLVVEIWGTSDGRTSTISDYTAWNKRSAPAPLYQEDPSLPRGTIKQIDWAAPGLNTKFSYTVNDAEGKERYKRDFTSYFQPWQAVYLVGTGT